MAGFCTTPWRWISGILAILCLLLMAILGIVLKNYSVCCSCQERWILYRCNCYFISSEPKTWNESQNICVSQNSTLFQMHNRDELHFMKLSSKFYWIGVIYSKELQTWVWLNGTALPPDLFSSYKTTNPKNCIVYNPNLGVQDQACMWTQLFICKQELTGVSWSRSGE
ncbi:natural killer cells antigen CD94-like [Talpa occidentalis]|uniref:natural killer cells antigen CD94-like n=1 Tax=Talpa occidentalis TaxID=50954 RepID=UPI00188F0314|nr:natural killer cells antigen CD94-like [Talpa occidentalis]